MAVSLLVILPGCALQTTNDDARSTTAQNGKAAVGTNVEYSDETFFELVKKYAVNDGENVDYAAWKSSAEDLSALQTQVNLIAAVSPKSHPDLFPTKGAERRYWINTYNTLVLDAVLDYWPLDSVKDVKLSLTSRIVPGKGFFYDRDIVVGGNTTSLWKLEKEVLRTQEDPRLHFALNCASGSCPVLRPSNWSEEELDQAASDFVNNPDNVAVDGKVVYLSEIFKWFRKDFPRDIYTYLQQYADTELDEKLAVAIKENYRKRYREYDWSLNEDSDTDTVADNAVEDGA